jgi:hypothetical protein
MRSRLRDLERVKGFEPSTPTLARLCSTTELHPHRAMHMDIGSILDRPPRITPIK